MAVGVPGVVQQVNTRPQGKRQDTCLKKSNSLEQYKTLLLLITYSALI